MNSRIKQIKEKAQRVNSPLPVQPSQPQMPINQSNVRKPIDFKRALLFTLGAVLILGIINLLIYRAPVTPIETTQTKLANILPRGSKGTLLISEGKTFLVVTNLTPEQFKELRDQKIQELENILDVENLEIEPSAGDLRKWQADEGIEEVGPDGDHEGETEL